MEDTADPTEIRGEDPVIPSPDIVADGSTPLSHPRNRSRPAHKRRRPGRVALIAVIALAAVFVVALIIDAILTGGTVHARVTAGGINVGGETLSGATRSLSAEADKLRERELSFHHGERTLTTTLEALGWQPDPAATATQAHAIGRGGPIPWVTQRIGTWVLGDQIPWTATWDRKTLRTIIGGWSDIVGLPIQEGSVQIAKGEITTTEPKAGTRIDVEGLMTEAEQAIADGTTDIQLPVLQAPPVSTAAAVAVATDQAETVVSGPIRVGIGHSSIVLSPEELGDLFTTTVNENETSVAQPVAGFDADRVDALLEPYKEQVERPAVNAAPTGMGSQNVDFSDSRNGKVIDPLVAATSLFKIATSDSRTGRIPLVVEAPDLTTQEARALGITERISTFTTYHPSGEARIVNIHLGADTIDGTVILPGKTFSLNEALGERTEAKGYVKAPAIFDGMIVEQVGGGISQLATTTFNAAFFAGFPIDEHQAHSFWFTRYPRGREATLGWKEPDLKFTNDLDTPVVIDTTYSETSITVSIWGTELTRKVTSSDDVTTEKDKEYYTVAVTREITDLDGKVIDREVFLTRYRQELTPTPTPTPDPD